MRIQIQNDQNDQEVYIAIEEKKVSRKGRLSFIKTC